MKHVKTCADVSWRGRGETGETFGEPPLRGVSPRVVSSVSPSLAGSPADLARRVDHLTISRRDPESFHAEKSEIAHSLRRLSKEASR